MSDVTRGRRRRLGRFRLGRRCKHAAVELGPIHEAHDARTGAPALVFTPGTGSMGRPKRDWQVRVHVRASPPFVALEVERAPDSGRLSELSDVFVLVLAGLEAVRHSKRVREHLTRERVPQPTALSILKGLAAAGLAVLVLCGVFWWSLVSHPMDVSSPASSAHGIAAAEDDARSLFLTGESTLPPVVSYPLPDKPLKGQAKPPCNTWRDEEAINGGCWVEIARRPPCIEKAQAEYKGKCYLPVHEPPPTPQSVEP